MYTNDRKAPRMKRGKFSKSVITNALWKQFRSKYPEYASKTDKELNTLWLEIASTIKEETISNPLGVKLGSYAGELKLQYLPHKFKNAVDISTSEELGDKINHLNITTRGKIAKIKWERRWAVKFNKMLQFFAFQPTRELHTMAKKHIDENAESLRMSRNTMGGTHLWKSLMQREAKNEYKKTSD